MSYNASASLASSSAAIGAVLLAALPASAQSCPDPAEIIGDLEGSLAHVRYLADDRLEGRAVGSAGARCAADYIAHHFEAIGLEPAGDGDSYFQAFPIRKGANAGQRNRLEIGGATLALGSDWAPVGFSASGSASGALVYGGRGVSSPGTPEDRYVRMDITDRVVVMDWGDPDAPNRTTLRSTTHFKATVAAGRDAAAVIVLLPDGMELPDIGSEDRNTVGVPTAVVAGARADEIREAAQTGAEVMLSTDVTPSMVDANNVVGLLPGSDPARADEVVIVGAHYDHLGFGGGGSLAPDRFAVHNGADDNASGTSAVIEVARAVASGPRPARSIVFMLFTGEERGLWGSEFFASNPTVDLDDAVAMLNLDMVGRVVDDRVTVYGFASASEWDAIVDAANADLDRPLNIGKAPDAFGPSDHTSFAAREIPVLHFFSNTHPDYHRPSDDWPKINVDGLDRVEALTGRIARTLATAAGRPVTWLTQEEEAPPHGVAASGDQSATSAYGGVYLGSIPDMTPRESGMRLTGVREGSPADIGGLRAGDVIVEFGGVEITDIYSYTYALQAHAPGDEVQIIAQRDGERVALTVVLGRR
ncbi:MAG: M28 family peptidase [Gemmatimonadota bacterium]